MFIVAKKIAYFLMCFLVSVITVLLAAIVRISLFILENSICFIYRYGYLIVYISVISAICLFAVCIYIFKILFERLFAFIFYYVRKSAVYGLISIIIIIYISLDNSDDYIYHDFNHKFSSKYYRTNYYLM